MVRSSTKAEWSAPHCPHACGATPDTPAEHNAPHLLSFCLVTADIAQCGLSRHAAGIGQRLVSDSPEADIEVVTGMVLANGEDYVACLPPAAVRFVFGEQGPNSRHAT